MEKIIVRVESLEDFMQYGHELAVKIDKGLPIEESCVRGFDDPDDLNELFTPDCVALVKEIYKQPGTARQLANRLSTEPEQFQNKLQQLLEIEIIYSVPQGSPEELVYHPVARSIEFETQPINAVDA